MIPERFRGTLRGGGLVRMLGTGVVNQALQSGSSFVVGLLLIRYTSDADYGLYVLAQSALLLLLTAQGAFVSMPMVVLLPRRSAAEQMAMMGSVDSSMQKIQRLFLLLVAVLVAVSWLLGWLDTGHALVALATVVAGWTSLRREYLRTAALVASRPELNLLADLPALAILMASAVAGALWLSHPAAWVVAGLASGAAISVVITRRRLNTAGSWTVRDAEPFWREMRPLAVWSSIGAMSYWVFSQGYNYLLAAQLNVEAVAAVNAARLMLMPVMLLAVGVKSQLLPLSARWLQDHGLSTMMRRLSVVIIGLIVANILYLGLLWLSRHWLTSTVLRKVIPDLDALLLLWAAVAMVALVRDLYQIGLLARERLRPLALLCVAGSIASVTVIFQTVDVLGARGAVIGLLAAEAIGLVGVLVLTFREIRNEKLKPLASS